MEAMSSYFASLDAKKVFQTESMKLGRTIQKQLEDAVNEKKKAITNEEMLTIEVRELKLKFDNLQLERQTAESSRNELQKALDEEKKKKKGGCFAVENVVETRTGLKTIGELNYYDEVKTPRGWSKILYLKNYEEPKSCVILRDCILTGDHLVYVQNNLVQAHTLSLRNPVKKYVRSVIVQGDSFYCSGLLVSSHTHFTWLPRLSLFIDWLPPPVIMFADWFLIGPLESIYDNNK